MKNLSYNHLKDCYLLEKHLRLGKSVDEIHSVTKYDKWFIEQINNLINLEKILIGKELDKDLILFAKKMVFQIKKYLLYLKLKKKKFVNLEI